MFEQLFELVKENSEDSIIKNPDVPNEHNEAVMGEATNSIVSSLQSMLANGQGKEVLGLFNSNPNEIQAQPAMQQISGNFMGSIMEKFGLNGSQASGLAASLIPMVLGKLINRTGNSSGASNGFNIQDIFNSLSNNGTSGMNIPGLLSKLSAGGFDKDGDGDVDLNDLTAAFSGVKQGSATQGAGLGAGILDSLKGMFGGK